MNKVFMGFGIIVILVLTSPAWSKIGGGDIIFKPKKAAQVIYSHDFHVGKLGLKCTNCHYRLYTTVEGHYTATMADMVKGKSCGACHNGKKAFDVNGNCDRCHKK